MLHKKTDKNTKRQRAICFLAVITTLFGNNKCLNRLYGVKMDENKSKNEPQEKKPILAIFSKLIGTEKEKEKQIENKEIQTFIPELKTDGKGKVNEIIVESPLDEKNPVKKNKEKNNVEEEGGDQKEIKDAIEETKFIKNTAKLLDEKTDKSNYNETEKTEYETNGNSKVSLLILENRNYDKGISILLKKMAYDYEKNMYVALNETIEEMENRFYEEKIEKKKFVIIDTLTLGSKNVNQKKYENCIFVASPNALIELSLAIMQGINNWKAKAILFDSISTLLIYENEKTVSRFVRSIIGKIRASGIDAYFTVLAGDSKKDVIKELRPFFDKANNLEEFVSEQFPGFEIESIKRQKWYDEDEELENYKTARLNSEPAIFMAEIQALKRKIKDSQKNNLMWKDLNYLKEKLEKLEGMKEKINKIEGLTENEKNKYKEISATLEEVKEKLKKMETVSKLEEEIKEVYRKIEEIDEKAQLSAELRKNIEAKKESELNESIQEMKVKLKNLEGVTSLEQEVKALNNMVLELESKLRKETKEEIEAQTEAMKEFSRQIDDLSKRISEAQKSDKYEEMAQNFGKELEAIKSEIDEMEKNNALVREKEHEEKEKVKQMIDEVKTKLAGLEKISEIEQHMTELYKKIEEHDEKAQLGEEIKKTIESQKTNEMKQAIEEMKKNFLAQEENISLFSKQIDALRQKLEETQATNLEKDELDRKLLEHISAMEKHISSLGKRLEAAELQKALAESEDEYKKISEEREQVEMALKRMTDEEGYTKEKLAKLNNQLEKISEIEKEINEKRKEMQERLKKLKQDE